MTLTELTQDEVLRLLSVRGPMHDTRLFAGRTAELRMLDGVVHPPHNCAWVFGAPKNGKSSLARVVKQKCEALGKRVVYVNAREVRPHDFDGLLRLAVYGDTASGAKADAQQAFVNMAAKTKDQPLLLIFDNFDRHAVQLGIDEQAFLRSKKETYSNLNYLFLTRMDPNRIVEDVPDEGSRLLGICRPLLLPIFSRSDVSDLCRQVAEAFGWNCYKEWAQQIISTVGGNPAAVMDALFGLVTSQLRDESAGQHAFSIFDDAPLRATLLSHWRGLPLACRVFLLGESEQGEEKNSALREGYWNSARGEPVRPEMLVEVGRDAGVRVVETTDQTAGTALAMLSNVHQLIDVVNLSMSRSNLPKVFSINDELLRYHPVARVIRDEHALHPAVEHLAKLLFEGARNRKPGVDATEDEWRIPDETARRQYAQSDGMRMLRFLRNYYDHIPHRDGVAAKREQEAGEWFEASCGVVVPHEPIHFEKIIEYLLTQLIAALQALATAVQNAKPSQ